MDEKATNTKCTTDQDDFNRKESLKDDDGGNYSSEACGNFTKNAVSAFEWELVKKDKRSNVIQ
jgi:hypothetical protein